MALRMAVLVAVAVAWPGQARALVVEPVTLDQMIGESDAVVVGAVEAVASRYEDAPAAGRIVTDVTVRVDRVARGAGEGLRVVFTLPGGVVAGRGQRVPGVPTVRAGDEVVVFLAPPTPTARGPRRSPIALSLGLFFVTRGTDRPARADQRLGGVATRSADFRMHRAEPLSIDLDDLLARVRAVPDSGRRP